MCTSSLQSTDSGLDCDTGFCGPALVARHSHLCIAARFIFSSSLEPTASPAASSLQTVRKRIASDRRTLGIEYRAENPFVSLGLHRTAPSTRIAQSAGHRSCHVNVEGARHLRLLWYTADLDRKFAADFSAACVRSIPSSISASRSSARFCDLPIWKDVLSPHENVDCCRAIDSSSKINKMLRRHVALRKSKLKILTRSKKPSSSAV